MLNGFKNFILRGNVVELATAVVIGAAFSQVVDALVSGIINPLVAAIFGEPNLDSVGAFTINNAVFLPGTILTAALNFLFVAAAIYFVIVLPANKLSELRKAKEEAEEELSHESLLLIEIRDLLRRNNAQA